MDKFFSIELDAEDTFECPECGRLILEPDEPLIGEGCPHLKWVHTTDGDSFEYVDPTFEEEQPELLARIAAAMHGSEDLDEDSEECAEIEAATESGDRIQNLWSGEGKYIYEVVHGGVACGPVCMVAYYGFVTADLSSSKSSDPATSSSL